MADGADDKGADRRMFAGRTRARSRDGAKMAGGGRERGAGTWCVIVTRMIASRAACTRVTSSPTRPGTKEKAQPLCRPTIACRRGRCLRRYGHLGREKKKRGLKPACVLHPMGVPERDARKSNKESVRRFLGSFRAGELAASPFFFRSSFIFSPV